MDHHGRRYDGSTLRAHHLGLWAMVVVLLAAVPAQLAAGASYTESRPSITTGVMAAGTYYLIVRTDADSTLAEVDDANNTLVYSPFTLSP